MDEEQIESSLETYKMQLSQVDAALLAAGEQNNQDLSKLREDLKELIALTEESLLNVKKEKLLSMVESVSGVTNPQTHTSVHSNINPHSSSSNGTTANEPQDDLDAEFAAFKACLGDEAGPSRSAAVSDESSSSEDEEDPAAEDVFKDIIGSRCQVPFSHSWGEQSQHNAMVIGVHLQEDSDSEGEEEPQVKILFTNPTHRSMVRCPYFLDDKCNYGDKCRFSHGHLIRLSQLKEYREADYSSLKLESHCLAQYTDRVWYPAVIVDLFPDNTVKVMFERNDEVITVKMEDLLPIELQKSNDSDGSSSGDEAGDPILHSSEEESELPVYLWRPDHGKQLMGQWEQHTRGIASKLMQRMGYVSGQGLGRDGQGRAEPVPIQLLPQGKSLDKIMELKALAGDRDLYDVMKRRQMQQKKAEAKNKAGYKREQEREKAETSVFDFINKKLHSQHTKKGSHGHQKHHSHRSNNIKEISVKDLSSKSDKSLNVQLFQTLEEIKSTEKEISRLQSTLSRNHQVDPVLSSRVQSKLAPLQKYLNQLQKSQYSLERHKQSRSDKKKLSVF